VRGVRGLGRCVGGVRGGWDEALEDGGEVSRKLAAGHDEIGTLVVCSLKHLGRDVGPKSNDGDGLVVGLDLFDQIEAGLTHFQIDQDRGNGVVELAVVDLVQAVFQGFGVAGRPAGHR